MIAYTAYFAYTIYIAYTACIACIAYICINFTYIYPPDCQIGETGLASYFQSMIMIEMMKTRGCCDYIELRCDEKCTAAGAQSSLFRWWVEAYMTIS